MVGVDVTGPAFLCARIDGLADFVIFNPQVPGGALQLLHNRGILPGSPPRLEARE